MISVFYVIGFADTRVADILNIMRFAANTEAKRTAHITIRGPYRRRLPKAVVRRFSQTITGAQICINGAGTFFHNQQNTVYLHCDSAAIKKVWHKPHHSYTPHLTIYDGNSRAIAKEIYDTLAHARINQTRAATAIAEMISPSAINELRPAIRPEMLMRITGTANINELSTATWQRRLQTIESAANYLACL